MKRRLEADLISIAHKILQLKNKSDIDQLFFETQKLYEKLTVLRFIESQYGDAKPTIGQAEMVHDLENYSPDTKIETLIPQEIPVEISVEAPVAPIIETVLETIIETAPIIEVEKETEIIETIEEPVLELIENLEETPVETPVIEEPKTEAVKHNAVDDLKETVKKMAPLYSPFIKKILKNSSFSKDSNKETAVEKNIEDEKETEEVVLEKKPVVETPKQPGSAPLSFKDLMGSGYFQEPQFVKVANNSQTPPVIKTEPELKPDVPAAKAPEVEKPAFAKPPSSINDRFSKKIEIDLNDQIAFVKHLFDNKLEDYNRALSQINTFASYPETKSFIDNMIKPDHNNWKDKTDYEDRFMHCIEKKFL